MRTRARLAALLTVGLALAGCGSHKVQALPTCTSGDVALTLEQAANAATIAAVGKRLGMPDHAVTIALATALQESKLRNLRYGDRDSLGLFQQRPSQGWGTPAQVQDPVQASTSFYRHLSRISGWEALPVTVAAQRVQHSGAPDAYAQWEAAARQLAQALTGELPAAFACQFQSAPHPGGGVQVQQRATVELGPGGLSRAGTQAQTWTTASWLVAQASTYGLSTVSVSGMTWTAKRGTWLANPKAAGLVWS